MKKYARKGTVFNPCSVEAQPARSDNSLKGYLDLNDQDAKGLPRLDLEAPVIYRGEHYCTRNAS
jgi:hypothetical protein